MAKCIRCGKKGLLVRVNSDGLCEECVQRQMAAMREAMTPEQRSYVGLKEQLSRLEQERIDELGDASVPFDFDVHAIIFSDDAPRLEAALHKAFEDRKLNMVNTRREFFHVTLEEIKEVVKKNYDKTAEFIEIPEAEQYRISLKMRQQNAEAIL